MSLSVEYDPQIFQRHARGGISRYFAELVRHFNDHQQLGVQPVLPQRFSINRHLADAVPGQQSIAFLPERARRRVFALERTLRKRRHVDIVHHTFYDELELASERSVPRVTTVHDMIPELFPELFPGGNPHLRKDRYVAASDLVICVSDATREDLMALYPGCRARVEVVPLGCSAAFERRRRAPAWAPDRYVLFVGSRRGYKDFDVLVDAKSQALKGVHLVCAGGGRVTEDERRRWTLAGLPAEELVQRDVTEDELVALYQHAVLFAFPSRYEGFGLPVLEAMTAGCPALLSDAKAFQEVAADAALYFPCGDSGALAVALERLANDAHLRQQIVRSGRMRAAKFSWFGTASHTAALYRELA